MGGFGVKLVDITEMLHICHYCKQRIGHYRTIEGKEYLSSLSVFQNVPAGICFLFHHKCKKKWIAEGGNLKREKKEK